MVEEAMCWGGKLGDGSKRWCGVEIGVAAGCWWGAVVACSRRVRGRHRGCRGGGRFLDDDEMKRGLTEWRDTWFVMGRRSSGDAAGAWGQGGGGVRRCWTLRINRKGGEQGWRSCWGWSEVRCCCWGWSNCRRSEKGLGWSGLTVETEGRWIRERGLQTCHFGNFFSLVLSGFFLLWFVYVLFLILFKYFFHSFVF